MSRISRMRKSTYYATRAISRSARPFLRSYTPRLTLYAARFTFHASRFPVLVSRFSFLASRLAPSRLIQVAYQITLDLANREGPDITWISEDLALGGQVLDDEWSAVAVAGVGAVVDCRAEGCDPVDVLDGHGIAFLHLPTPDASNFQPEQVSEGVAWVEQQLADGRPTLIHCRAGKGRSVLIAAAVLTRRGFSADEALTIIRQRRPIVTPTPGQIARLREFARSESIDDTLASAGVRLANSRSLPTSN